MLLRHKIGAVFWVTGWLSVCSMMASSVLMYPEPRSPFIEWFTLLMPSAGLGILIGAILNIDMPEYG